MPNTAVVKPQPGDEATAPWAQSVADALNGIQTGSGSFSMTSQATASVVVTFPRPFSSAPAVTVSLTSGPGGSAALVPRCNGITATGFTLLVYNVPSGNATVTAQTFNWIAVGPPA
jgi:hypothetical protein